MIVIRLKISHKQDRYTYVTKQCLKTFVILDIIHGNIGIALSRNCTHRIGVRGVLILQGPIPTGY